MKESISASSFLSKFTAKPECPHARMSTTVSGRTFSRRSINRRNRSRKIASSPEKSAYSKGRKTPSGRKSPRETIA
jgi:hypothetical protein